MGIKINQLPSASTINISDYFPIVQNNTTKKIDLDALINCALVSKQQYEKTVEELNKIKEEMIQARDIYCDLKTRLAKENEKIYETINANSFKQFSGNNLKINNSKIGYVKDTIIKPQTDQNINNISHVKFNTIDDFVDIDTTITSFEDGYIVVNSETPATDYIHAYTKPFSLVKPNTVYTAIIDVLENTLSLDYIFSQPGDGQFDGTMLLTKKVTGRILKKMTSNRDVTNVTCGLNSYYFEGCTGKIKFRYSILEGDWTNKEIPSSITRIESVGDKENNKISILSISKNLCPINKISIRQARYVITKTPIKLKPNTYYSISSNAQLNVLVTNTLIDSVPVDWNQDVLYSQIVANNKGYEYGTSEQGQCSFLNKDWKYAYITTWIKNDNGVDVENLMFCEGQNDFDFVPYKEGNKISISSFEKASLIPKEYFLKGQISPATIKTGDYKGRIGTVFEDSLNLNNVKVVAKLNKIFDANTPLGVFCDTQSIILNEGQEKSFIAEKLTSLGFYKWASFSDGNGKDRILEYLTTGALELTVLSTQNNNNYRLYPNFNAKQSQKEILLPIQDGLKSFPNGICDTIEERDDGVYLVQKIDKYDIKEGDEIRTDGPPNQHNTIAFSINVDARNIKIAGNNICNNFNCITDGDSYWNCDKEGVLNSENAQFKFRILRSKLSTQDVDGIKAWVKANPITICYELNTQIETKLDIDTINLQTFENLTYISSDNDGLIFDLKAPVNSK